MNTNTDGVSAMSAEFDDVPDGYSGAYAKSRNIGPTVTILFETTGQALQFIDRLRSRWDAKQRLAASSNTSYTTPPVV